jgi:signal transduction histidine kinase
VPPVGLVVDGDATRLAQVFGNLLNNAARYTEPGGRIRLALHAADSQAVVSVADNGIGIPDEMQARIFDIFTQVHRTIEKSQGGLGIGLSLAKRLVEMHGGAIEVRSAGLGRGSEFVVRLPARVAAAQPA